MRSNYKKIGSYLRLVDERDSDQRLITLLGLTIDKVFIPSVANTIGSDMANYKIIRKGQFACSLMQVRRDKRIPVALLTDFDEAIISQAYPVFEVVNTELLPEYLMMWMSRSEFDREACFYAVGGVRGSLEWEDFCNMELPVPSPEKQLEIVKEFHTIVDRIKLNERLNQKLEETAQAIYKQWFVDFEFPILAEYAAVIGKPELEGHPYKSSGGEMVFNEVLKQEIPKEWEDITVEGFCAEMKSGGTPDRGTPDFWDSADVPWLKTGEVCNCVLVDAEEYISFEGLKNSSARKIPANAVLIAMYGDGKTKGQVGYLKFESTTNQACCAMICSDEFKSTFLFYHLRTNRDEIVNQANGGAQDNLSKALIAALPILKPQQWVLNSHPFVTIINNSENLIRENRALGKLHDLLLSRLAKGANS